MQLGSGQDLVTGNGGGISSRARRRLARLVVVDSNRAVLELRWSCPLQSCMSDCASTADRALMRDGLKVFGDPRPDWPC